MKQTKICKEVIRKFGKIKSLVDVGCGRGEFVNCIAKNLKIKAIGIDISDLGFRKAEKLCSKEKLCRYVECVKKDAENLDKILKGKVEVVTFLYSLHHFSNPVKVLKATHKILELKGKVLIGDYWVGENARRHGCYKYSVGDYARMLEKAGFGYLGFDRQEENFVFVIGEKVKR